MDLSEKKNKKYCAHQETPDRQPETKEHVSFVSNSDWMHTCLLICPYPKLAGSVHGRLEFNNSPQLAIVSRSVETWLPLTTYYSFDGNS